MELQSGKMIIETECVRFAKFGGFFNNFGRFFKIKVKIIKYRSLRCLEIAKWEDDYGNWMCKICKIWRIFQQFWKNFPKIDIKVIIIDVWKSRKRLVIYISLQMSCKVLLRQLIIHDFINLYLIGLDHF